MDAKSPLLEEDSLEQDEVRLLEAAQPRRTSIDVEMAHSKSAYAIMLILGMGLLMPWNVILNTLTYLNKEWTDQGHSSFEYEFRASLAYIYPQLPIVIAMVKWGNHVSYTKRITSTFVIQGLCLVLMPAVAKVSPWLVMMLIFIIGVCTAVCQSSLFGFASMFPPMFNQALMAGQGVAGIAASVLRIITKGSFGDKHLTGSAIVYFALAGVTLITCTILYVFLLRMAFAQYHLSAGAAPRTKTVPADSPSGPGQPFRPLTDDALMTPMSKAALISAQESPTPEGGVSIISILQKIKLMCFVEFGIFFMTFAVFPGDIVDLEYKYSIKSSALNFMGRAGWFSVIQFFVFNIFDTLGRSLPGACQILSYTGVAVVTAFRFLLIPVYIACVRYETTSPFDNDVFVLVLMMVFALSNGYCSSLGMMYGPGKVARHERETAGLILSVFLQGGICLGSTAALGLKHFN